MEANEFKASQHYITSPLLKENRKKRCTIVQQNNKTDMANPKVNDGKWPADKPRQDSRTLTMITRH